MENNKLRSIKLLFPGEWQMLMRTQPGPVAAALFELVMTMSLTMLPAIL